MNRIIQKSGRAIQTSTKYRAKIFAIFLHRELCMKKSVKIYKCVFYWKKQP